MDNGASSYRRYLNGDDRGITEIVEEYKDGLILYIHGQVDNYSAAEELAEEAFYRLITRRPRFSGRSSFKSWLYAIGHHVAVDYLRRRSRLHATPVEELAEVLADGTDLNTRGRFSCVNTCKQNIFSHRGSSHIGAGLIFV